MRIAETLLADPAGAYRQQHLSLMHGWLPLTVQAVTALLLLTAIGWRNRRWRLVWLPIAAGLGVAMSVAAYWYISSEGMADDPAPKLLWIWIAGVVAGRFRGRPVGRLAWCPVVAAQRGGGRVSAVHPVCRAGPEPVGGLLPHRPDRVEPADRRAAARSDRPNHRGGDAAGAQDSTARHGGAGDISHAASGFRHRGELVYLPPAWYATNPPPKLPTLMMIGGEFNTPGDWCVRRAVKTLDDFAAAHPATRR